LKPFGDKNKKSKKSCLLAQAVWRRPMKLKPPCAGFSSPL
jgi:hypothetical protein